MSRAQRVPGRTCAAYAANTGNVRLSHGELITMGIEARRVCRSTRAPWARCKGQSRYPDAVLAAALAIVLERRAAMRGAVHSEILDTAQLRPSPFGSAG